MDSGAQVLAALLQAMPLPVCARNLWRPGDKPFTIAFNDRCKFVPHGTSIERNLRFRETENHVSLRREVDKAALGVGGDQLDRYLVSHVEAFAALD